MSKRLCIYMSVIYESNVYSLKLMDFALFWEKVERTKSN